MINGSNLSLRHATSFALLVAAIGVVLILQGWKSRIPSFGVLVTIDVVQDLIEHHRLPERGAIASFAAITPPGLAWLMLPGMLVFQDPRLFEYVGSLAMYIGELLAIFALARRCFGTGTAALAVAIDGLSELGLTAGGTLFSILPS